VIRNFLYVFLLMFSSSVCGQEITTTVLEAKNELVSEAHDMIDQQDMIDQDIYSAIGLALGNALTPGLNREETINGSGAVLRGLVRINGKTNDFTLRAGSRENFGSLNVILHECRYPKGNREGNAFASIEIRETGYDDSLFAGWMVASAPALNALDHSRYDLWVLRCTTS